MYSVQWSPKSLEFCVVYGFMPAKATLFNLKCEPIFHFGEGIKNSVEYNPFGNNILLFFNFFLKQKKYNRKFIRILHGYFLNSWELLIFGGFGNLRGTIELWDATNRKIISKVDAPDTTLLRWSPDGEHFMTATTAPRLREGNGWVSFFFFFPS